MKPENSTLASAPFLMEQFPIMRKMERFKMAGSTAGMEEASAKTAFCRQAGRRSTEKILFYGKRVCPDWLETAG